MTVYIAKVLLRNGVDGLHVRDNSGSVLLAHQPINDMTVTSTDVLQKPVDYALAGHQPRVKTGRAPFSALRGIFRE